MQQLQRDDGKDIHEQLQNLPAIDLQTSDRTVLKNRSASSNGPSTFESIFATN